MKHFSARMTITPLSRYAMIMACVCKTTIFIAQPTYQRATASSGNVDPHFTYTVRTNDGGAVLRVTGSPGTNLLKIDAQGDTLWSRHSPLSFLSYDRMPDGGVIGLIDGGTLDLTGGDWWGSDSTYNDLILVRVAGSGSLAWAKLFRLKSPQPFDGPPGHDLEALKTDPAGRIFVSGLVTGTGGPGPYNSFILCVDENGAVDWGSWFGAPLMQNAYSPRPHHLAPDGIGGCYFVSDDTGNLAQLEMGRLRNDGSLAWISHVVYGSNPGSAAWWPGGMSASPDHLLAAGEIENGVGHRWYTLDIDTTGQFRLYAAYSTDPDMAGGGYMLAPSVNELPSGDLLLTGHSSALRLLKVTATGQVLAAAHTSGSNNGQHAINTGMGAIDVLDSSMSTTALIDDMELVFGYHTYTNGFWALGTNTLTGCGLEPVSVTSDTTSSANIITMDPETGASSLPIQCSVIDTTFTIAAALSPATFEFCGFLGINEAPVRDHSIIIVGSPVSSGSGIPVESSSAATIDLLNSAGQCLASQRIGANTPEILRGSDALRAGIYLVRATDPQGHAIGTAKVIVE